MGAGHGGDLGRSADAIPGFRNRMMAFLVTRLMPRRLAGWLFKKMLGRALKIGLPAAPVAST